MTLRVSLYILIFWLSGFPINKFFAQELNANVSVIRTGGSIISDNSVLEDMENIIASFLNDQSWTDNSYQSHEKIECSFQLNLTSESPDGALVFQSSLFVSSNRPVYGSDYDSKVFVHNDPSVTFVYQPGRPLRFSENRFQDNLSSVLAFYAYIIIGMDFDSYGLMAGEPYYQMANQVLNQVPDLGNNKPWFGNNDNQNRYWMMQNFIGGQYRKFRQGLYKYHREGLDVMYEDAVEGRKQITDALNIMDSGYNNSPNQMVYQVLANAKSEELVEIFKGAPTYSEKNKVVRIIQRFDPSKARILKELK